MHEYYRNFTYPLVMTISTLVIIGHSLGLYLFVIVNKRNNFNVNTALIKCLSIGEMLYGAICLIEDVFFLEGHAWYFGNFNEFILYPINLTTLVLITTNRFFGSVYPIKYRLYAVYCHYKLLHTARRCSL